MITIDEHRQRRQSLIAALREHDPAPVAVIQGAPKEAAHARFRQYNDLMYLCPIETPHAYLVIDARAGADEAATTHLFLPHQPPQRLKSEGELLSASNPQQTKDRTGVDEVHGLDELATFLERVRSIYTPMRRGEGMTQSWDTLHRAQQERASDPWDGG